MIAKSEAGQEKAQTVKIDGKGLTYKELNARIRAALRAGETEIVLDNINGHRYIGVNLDGGANIVINGVPGNDLAFAMNGPTITVNGNAQDAICNTMSDGKVVVNGNAGDICGYAMRGGKIFLKGNVGYRAGIHIKEFEDTRPIIIIGGRAGNFLGEYMAGGLIVVLGMGANGQEIAGDYCGTGMHGGVIYLRKSIPEWKLGKEVKTAAVNQEDVALLRELLKEYAHDLNIPPETLPDPSGFIKLYPGSSRPYGQLYAY